MVSDASSAGDKVERQFSSTVSWSQPSEADLFHRSFRCAKEGEPQDPSWEISNMPDMEITCAECGNTFPFTEREQEYYQERNLTHPKRCKPCRDARRSNFGGPRGGSDRQRFEITCDQCGKNDSVPFKPSSGRPVLCGECFSANRAAQPRT